MKIKYSDSIRKDVPKEILYQLIELVFSRGAKETLHLFTVFPLNPDKLCIVHSIPKIHSYHSLIVQNCYESSMPQNFIALKYSDTLYMLTEDEYKKLIR